MADAMNYKPGDLPDLKYASEGLIPRVIGCTKKLSVKDRFICVCRVVVLMTLFLLE